MANPQGFPSLKQFVESIQSADLRTLSARADAKVADERAVADMKAHILKLYDKAEAPHSFMDESGAIFDCIPIEQQPSLRGSRGPVPKAPDAPQHEAAASAGPPDEKKDSLIPSPLGTDKKDRHGNVMHGPPGTIPMRRVTLEDLTRFVSLRDFFRKGPRGAGRPPRAI